MALITMKLIFVLLFVSNAQLAATLRCIQFETVEPYDKYDFLFFINCMLFTEILNNSIFKNNVLTQLQTKKKEWNEAQRHKFWQELPATLDINILVSLIRTFKTEQVASSQIPRWSDPIPEQVPSRASDPNSPILPLGANTDF